MNEQLLDVLGAGSEAIPCPEFYKVANLIAEA